MTEQKEKPRTINQNSAIHLYLTQVAEELRNQGQSMQNVVKKISKVEIIPTQKNLKELVWREIQKAQCNKESSAKLTVEEVTQVYEVMAKFMAMYFEISIPFPSEDEMMRQEMERP